MVFVKQDSVEWWREIARQFEMQSEGNADAAVAWIKIADMRHRTIRKLAWTCYGLGVAVLVLGVALWLKW